MSDINRLVEMELPRWDAIDRGLKASNELTAISSGLSQYAMASLINHVNGFAAYTEPSAIWMALCTTAPTSTSTGSTLAEASYTGYARLNITSDMGAASAATPSVATNSSACTFAACTGGTSTLLGFAICDASSDGDVLWYGTLPSVVVSTTATPATVAPSALSLSITGT